MLIFWSSWTLRSFWFFKILHCRDLWISELFCTPPLLAQGVQKQRWGSCCWVLPWDDADCDFWLPANAGDAALGVPNTLWEIPVGADCWVGEPTKGLEEVPPNSKRGLMEIWGSSHIICYGCCFPILIFQKLFSSIPAPASPSSSAIVLSTQWPVVLVIVINMRCQHIHTQGPLAWKWRGLFRMSDWDTADRGDPWRT